MSAPGPLDARNWRPLDAGALSGGFQMVADAHLFAVARWDGARFVFSSGVPIGIEPTRYYAPGRAGSGSHAA